MMGMKSMFDNNLDVLDSMLKVAGNEKWGWHIYRCTYSPDDGWSTFMEKLRTATQSTISFYGGTFRAVAKQQIFTVVEDRERLENATKSDARSMFRDWVNSPEAAAEQPNAKVPLSVAPMARYLYLMHVDEESLRSVFDDSNDWHINIIDRSWTPWREENMMVKITTTMKRIPMKHTFRLRSKAAPRRTWVGRSFEKDPVMQLHRPLRTELLVHLLFAPTT